MSQIKNISNLLPGCLIDRFGRRLHYLRLSITDHCNLRCLYCMPSKGIAKLSYKEVLTLEELARFSRIAVKMGIDKIRFTGGEPLVRRNFSSLLKKINMLSPRPDLRLTTNGLLLVENLSMLKEYGISTINVSLDTLRSERYSIITGLDFRDGARVFTRVWAGIEAALASGVFMVKINTVLLAGINEDEVEEFARLTLDLPVVVRFIEYMPVGRCTFFQPCRFLPVEEILRRLRTSIGELILLPSRDGDGPAQRYCFKNSVGELGVISALTSHFCRCCNRIRLSAEGLLVPCLFSDQTLNVKTVLRSRVNDYQLVEILLQAVAIKQERHVQNNLSIYPTGCQMSRLGG